MTAVPSLLTWDCVGYWANAAGTIARKVASNPYPSQFLADRMTFLWLLDIVNGSFFIYSQLERPSQNQPDAQSSASRSSRSSHREWIVEVRIKCLALDITFSSAWPC